MHGTESMMKYFCEQSGIKYNEQQEKEKPAEKNLLYPTTRMENSAAMRERSSSIGAHHLQGHDALDQRLQQIQLEKVTVEIYAYFFGSQNFDKPITCIF